MKSRKESILVTLLCFLIMVLNTVPLNAVEYDNQENTNENNIVETSDHDINDPKYEVESEDINSSNDEEKDHSINNNQSSTINNEVYYNGHIHIYNLKQLQAIGTNKSVKINDNDINTFGLGEDIAQKITYSLDATYVLENEISLNNEYWNLPKDFSGKFISNTKQINHSIYDENTNTVYISNSFQLDLIDNFYNGKEASPILSNDLDVNMFGSGQMIYPTGSDQYLYYDDTHNYVITTDFNEQRPLNEYIKTQMEATARPEIESYVQKDATNAYLSGRDYVGQVYKKINDKDYILIGNKEQLAAIGSNKQVTPMLFLRIQEKSSITGAIKKETLIPYYPGDADFEINNIVDTGITYSNIEDGTKEFQYKKEVKKANELMDIKWGAENLLDGIVSAIGGLLSGLLELFKNSSKELVGLKIDQNNNASIDANKNYTPFNDLKKDYEHLKYSSDANYIIFRDIDLANVDWKPLMFSGYITGAKTDDGSAGSLWTNGNIKEVTISNISVNQNDPIDMQKQSGVGFFGSIVSNATNNVFDDRVDIVSKGTVVVKNITLNNVKVVNNTNKIIDSKDGIIDILMRILGDLFTVLLGDTLGTILNGLLNPDSNKTIFATFATGAFAGRIVGEVVVENCKVEGNIEVVNINNRTGGFAGHIEGITEYKVVGQVLNGLVGLLENLLNIIPGIDIGTLIHILLNGNIIKLENLVPTGYKQPKINNCHIIQADGSDSFVIGKDDTISVGGFAGNIIGAQIIDSSVEVSNLEVKGNSLAGGFAGLVSNGELVGILEDLGIELINHVLLNSFILNCNVSADTISINAVQKYSGGFTGALANSFIVDSLIQGKGNINISSENYAGGFTGIASLGQSISLGNEIYTGKKDLLSLISKITGEILGNDVDALLSLTGVSPSVLSGISIDGSLSVTSKDYAGGLVGKGDGVQIYPSDKLKDESYAWQKAELPYDPKGWSTKITNLSKVNGQNYVGGLIGEATTASAAGLLNRALGVGNFLGFDINDATIDSVSGIQINATNECAGGLAGRAIGGNITNANVNNLKTVTADNMAGGFVGHGGTGSFAETGGLKILGLAEIKNLISLADGVVLKIVNSNVSGSDSGLTVIASGGNNQGTAEVKKYYAGGYIGKSTSVHIDQSHVTNLKNVEASMQYGYAGGFAGITETGGLAEAANGDSNIVNTLKIEGLLKAAPYLVSKFYDVSVTYIPDDLNPQVKGSRAGGFVGRMQSGYVVNNNQVSSDPYVVYNIRNVEGQYYAGGFAGEIVAGGLAEANDLSILNGIIGEIQNLLDVLNVYIPKIERAGVLSYDNLTSEEDKLNVGLIVKNNAFDESDGNSGSAGGYAGYASAAHISLSDVKQLRNTKVSAPSDLNSDDGSSYYGTDSNYAIDAKRYAGGYVGKLDIGNTGSIGGLNLLGVINISDLTSVLDVAASKIEYSDVYGALGGYSVIANDSSDNTTYGIRNGRGNAGGYAGAIYGSQLQNCDSYNINYIIGKETAGGYVGAFEPGNVVSVLGEGKGVVILGGLITSDNLLSALQTFIPMIYNSQAKCVPCGGVIRADGMASDGRPKGLAGGYVGHNVGGRIEGNSNRGRNSADLDLVELKENTIYRLRSVYGYEFAGGFSGRSESANIVDTGSLNILSKFIKINILSAVQAVYFTETNTATYGPLKGVTVTEWNKWVEAVGKNGAFGPMISQVENEEALNAMINQYAYGYEVKAGREIAGKTIIEGGVAGGYVGRMDGGKITSAHANDLKLVTSSRSSGGFAGEMMSAGAVNVGTLNLGDLDIIGNLGVLKTFVPVVNSSSATGYKSGATILATGTDIDNYQGNAGGYVGYAVGAQIEGIEQEFCSISNLRTVKGTNTVGGFAGSILTGSALDVKVGTKDSLLPQILGFLIKDAGKLAQVLNATLSKVTYAKVEAWDDWGVTVDGLYTSPNDQNPKYAYAAGGFVGNLSGSILGDRDKVVDSVIANNIRSVVGGEHVGGFFGLADVGALTQVGEDKNQTSILDLVQLGNLDVLDTFRPYIYHGKVVGSPINGLSVSANHARETGVINEIRYTGNAGGFGGSLLNGSVKNSDVTNLNQVNGLNYVGGFVGHLGKSGVVSLNQASIGDKLPNLLNATAGVLDNFGSHIDDSKVSGFDYGYTVKSTNGNQEIAGGFAGYADLAKINNSNANNLKKVSSSKTAGGFVGQATFSYLTNIEASSNSLLNPVLSIVNALLDILYFDELQKVDLIEINLGLGKILELKVASDGDLLSVTLLGLKISVALVKNNGDGTSDLAQIHIGDSYIELPCTSEKGNHIDKDDTNLKIGLIKSNRTGIRKSSVTGISGGYDVFGGNATDMTDSNTIKDGIAGGFAGFNHEGLIQDCDMFYADTIKGSSGKIGPFSGVTDLESIYDIATVKNIEGVNNHYRIYRLTNFNQLITDKGKLNGVLDANGKYNSFVISHRNFVEEYGDLKSSKLSSENEQTDAKVYISDAKAVLMGDVITTENDETTTPPPSEMQDPCNSTIDLTINKIWNDFGSYETRPESITVILKRYIVEAGQAEQLDQSYSKEIKIDGNKENNIWQHIEKDLLMIIDNGQAHYRYVLEEASVSGYSSKIEYSDDGFTITITNTRMPLLPETGGMGDRWFVIIGVLGISMILTSYLRRKEDEIKN